MAPTQHAATATAKPDDNGRLSLDIPVLIDGHTVNALVDTGADYSIMSGRLTRGLKKVTTPWWGPKIRTAGGHIVTPLGVCTARVSIRESTFVANFLIMPECSRDLILGMDFLREHAAVINLRERRIAFATEQAAEKSDNNGCRRKLRVIEEGVNVPPRTSVLVQVECAEMKNGEVIAEGNHSLLLTAHICVARGIVQLRDGRAELLVTNFGYENRRLFRGTTVAYVDEITEVVECFAFEEDRGDCNRKPTLENVDINPELSEEQKTKLAELLSKFQDCFTSSTKLRRTPITKHRIITDDASPIRQQPYRVSSKEREAIEKQVKEMLEDDIIQPSSSPWSSPVVLVRKKDGTLRFCVDYRKLNSVTKKDTYPLPRIDDSLDRLRRAKYFSSIDLRSGYWQIEVDERDREKTAFVTPDGLYEFKVLPFGLCSAPATFQRMMDTVLTGLKWQTCLVYLDDVVVFSETFEQHLQRLKKVLEAVQSASLSLKPEKCHFGFTELKFLGHVVSADGVRPDPEKTAAVASYPAPRDKKGVRRFLGLCAYYRRFISNFSRIAEPLTRLTREDVPFLWTEEQEEAFRELRHRLQSPPVLAHFNEEAETELHTDASSMGLGAVLVQWQEGAEKVIAYASRALSRAESNYCTTERECLAVIWAITKFRPYLYGRPFKVITDHHSLCWLANLKDPSGRLARWSLRLQEFNVTIAYKSGRKHNDADSLSRAPVESPCENADDETTSLCAITTSELSAKQRADSDLLPLIDHLEGRSATIPRYLSRALSSFVLQNGVLYKKNGESSDRAYLLVIPQDLRDDILFACHDEPTAGHLGFTRTLARVRQKYYWPRLTASVKRYVQTCRQCQRRKTPPLRPAGLLQPIEPPAKPFEQIGMDLLGPFPLSASGNKWIVVATDYLTRYAETKPLSRGTAAEVAKFFIENIVLRHGAPSRIVTDRGTPFTAHLMQETLELSRTTHRKTTAYHPQTNGLTERLNKTLADMLSMYVDVQQKTWDEILPYVTFAYNTATQETIRFTPFRLVYGREVQTMLDAMLPFEEEHLATPDAEQFAERAEETRQLARLHIQRQQLSDAARYNIRHREVYYRPGDRVWVWTPIRRPGLSEKLLHRYFGPYKIVQRLSDVTYEVIPDGTAGQRRQPRTETVHVVRLKPYFRR